MFIFDFVTDTVMDQIVNWLYVQVIGFLGSFFAQMSNMGAELFTAPWVTGIVSFFGYFAWGLYITGLIVAGFEFAIESQTGRASMRDLGLNTFKGLIAAELFNVLPIELYKLSVDMQHSLANGIMNSMSLSNLNLGEMANTAIATVTADTGTNPLWILFSVIMVGYSVIKVFFANLKRGGILLIQIAVGSLYMFSVPRGYIDGFMQWCKQVIGLCMTAFLQVVILMIGLLVLKDHMLPGFGLMLSSTEVPRIAGVFGLDTGTKANIMSTVYAAQSVVNLGSRVAGAVKP